MDLWSIMTEGSGSLPTADEVDQQLREAGFAHVESGAMLPSFVAFVAR